MAYLILIGVQRFIFIVGTGFFLAVAREWVFAPKSRAGLIEKMLFYWRWVAVFAVLLLLSIPALFAETEIHHQDANVGETQLAPLTPSNLPMLRHLFESFSQLALQAIHATLLKFHGERNGISPKIYDNTKNQ